MVSPCNLEFGKSFILISTVFFVFFLLCCAVLCCAVLCYYGCGCGCVVVDALAPLLSLFERFENLGIIYCRGDPYFEGLFFCRKRIYIMTIYYLTEDNTTNHFQRRHREKRRNEPGMVEFGIYGSQVRETTNSRDTGYHVKEKI